MEQDGQGESANRLQEEEDKDSGEERVRKEGTGRSRVGRPCSPHPEKGIQLKWPNPLSREYLAFGIL